MKNIKTILKDIERGKKIRILHACETGSRAWGFTQIKKAYGLEKKIVNPVEEKRKSMLDFCFVYIDKKTVSMESFLKQKEFRHENIGLAAIPHLRDCYNMYHSIEWNYSGIIKNEKPNDVNLSSIPKNESQVAMLSFNKDGYSVYCKRYKEYWDWVEKRNEERYKNTMLHGKNYDSKNMMHVFRLLIMAKEIATEGKINVFRSDREFLLDIKQGKYEYDDLVNKAEDLKSQLPLLYANSNLMDAPDIEKINGILVEMREKYYNQ